MYDVAIIGGGIHGAGVAQAAAVAGYSVILLEQHDIGDGTSSKSSKLIHGGLRYLESGQFSLVKECLEERALLLKNAPHLVELKPFIIPIYMNTIRSAFTIRVGLSLYAMLGGLRGSSRFNSIPITEWEGLDGLSTEHLTHVFQYWDAQTNDKLLTQAVIKSAEEYSAKIITQAKLLKATYVGKEQVEQEQKKTRQGDEHWSLQYLHHEKVHNVKASVVINASGPWVNRVNQRISSKLSNIDVDLVQGAHIIVKGEVTKGIYYLEAPSDQRAVFVMPWYGDTMIGTTERNFTGDPSDVAPTDDEVDYLLQTAAHYFPKLRSFDRASIVEKFAGLRVLPSDSGSAFSRSRETIVHEDKVNGARLFSIYGGKLTAYRATAESVIDKIKHYLPQRKVIGDTKKIKLPLLKEEG